jgi:hypothetical protein
LVGFGLVWCGWVGGFGVEPVQSRVIALVYYKHKERRKNRLVWQLNWTAESAAGQAPLTIICLSVSSGRARCTSTTRTEVVLLSMIPRLASLRLLCRVRHGGNGPQSTTDRCEKEELDIKEICCCPLCQ